MRGEEKKKRGKTKCWPPISFVEISNLSLPLVLSLSNLTPKKSFSWYAAHATTAHTATRFQGRSAIASRSSRPCEVVVVVDDDEFDDEAMLDDADALVVGDDVFQKPPLLLLLPCCQLGDDDAAAEVTTFSFRLRGAG